MTTGLGRKMVGFWMYIVGPSGLRITEFLGTDFFSPTSKLSNFSETSTFASMDSLLMLVDLSMLVLWDVLELFEVSETCLLNLEDFIMAVLNVLVRLNNFWFRISLHGDKSTERERPIKVNNELQFVSQEF